MSVLPIFVGVWLSGCRTTETVFVEQGAPVMLAEPAKAKVFVPTADGGWKRSSKPVRIPAGWICQYIPGEAAPESGDE